MTCNIRRLIIVCSRFVSAGAVTCRTRMSELLLLILIVIVRTKHNDTDPRKQSGNNIHCYRLHNRVINARVYVSVCALVAAKGSIRTRRSRVLGCARVWGMAGRPAPPHTEEYDDGRSRGTLKTRRHCHECGRRPRV